MRQKLANIMFDFIERTRDAGSPDALAELMRSTVAPLGVEQFAIAGLPPTHQGIRDHILLNEWPKSWFERYADKHYIRDDPVVRLIQQRREAVLWSEAIDHRGLASRARRIMNEAAMAGLKDGFTVPLVSPRRTPAVASFAGSSMRLTHEGCSVLHMIAIHAHTRLSELIGIEASDIRLSPGESECVAWCAEGKTDWEIGQITNRSARTVHNLIVNAQRKLNVVNRPQMIAEVFRRHIQD